MSFDETDIHRLIDGELTPEREAEVRAWINADPARARLADELRDQVALLHARFDPLLVEPVPPHLVAKVQAPAAVNSARFLRVAGQALFGLACAGAGWMGHVWLGADTQPDAWAGLAQRAAVAHAVYLPEVRHAVEVGADQETHLVQWLSKRLTVPVRAPSLSRHGYRLVGGRLLPSDDAPMAQFMYQNDAGKRLTLYVVAKGVSKRASAQQESAFRFERVGNVNVFQWVDERSAYALSGEIVREELLPIARTVYDDLQTR